MSGQRRARQCSRYYRNLRQVIGIGHNNQRSAREGPYLPNSLNLKSVAELKLQREPVVARPSSGKRRCHKMGGSES